MEILYLNAEKSNRREKYNEFIDSDHWKRVMVQYPDRVRYHAANLAAHNWDVIDAGDRLLVACCWSGGDWWFKDGSSVGLTAEEFDRFYPPLPQPNYDTATREETRRWENATSQSGVRRDHKIVLD